MLKIKTIPLGELQTNSYLLYDDETKEACIIDLGSYPSFHLKLLEELELQLKMFLFTHGHYDHIKGLEVIDTLSKDISVYIGKEDIEAISNPEINLSYLLGESLSYPDINPHPLKEGDKLNLGNYELQIFSFPGHTPGSLGIFVENHLFSGDTIFYGSVGRTDLPRGNPYLLKETIEKIKKTFPPETIIYPGHGEKTILKRELKLNPFF